jgi:hypothetical protein
MDVSGGDGGQGFHGINGRSRDNRFRDGSHRLTSRAALALEASAKTEKLNMQEISEIFPSRQMDCLFLL